METNASFVLSVLPSSETAKTILSYILGIFREASRSVDRIVSPSLNTGITTVILAATVSRACNLLCPLIEKFFDDSSVRSVCSYVPIYGAPHSLFKAHGWLPAQQGSRS